MLFIYLCKNSSPALDFMKRNSHFLCLHVCFLKISKIKIGQSSYVYPFGKNTKDEDDTLWELKLLWRGHPAMINTQQQAVLDQTFTL